MSQSEQDDNSMWEPPSISGRPRVYLPLVDRSCIDMFYDVVEKIREIVFVEMPAFRGRLLYPDAVVEKTTTVLYPPSEDDDDEYSYRISFGIIVRNVAHRGLLIVSYPGGRRIRIQKRRWVGNVRVFNYDINMPHPGEGTISRISSADNDGYSQSTIVNGRNELALTNAFPHLRIDNIERLRLWLLIPLWQNINRFHNHSMAYNELLERTEELNTNQAQQRLNLEQVLTHMMVPRPTNHLIGGDRLRGAEDIWRMVHRFYLEQQARERQGVYHR